MRKYGYYFFVAFSQNLVFRFDLLLDIVSLLFRFTIILFIWYAVFKDTSSFESYTLQDVTWYSILSILIVKLTSSSFEDSRTEEVRQGTADLWFTKPIAYPLQILLGALAKTIAGFIVLIPVLVVGLGWFIQTTGTVMLPSITSIGIFGLLVMVGWLVEHCIGLWIVAGSFWLEGAAGLQHFKWFVITIVSGSMLPPALLPTKLRELIEILPFQYMYAVPINIILGKQTWTIIDSFLLSGWMLILAGFTWFIWQKAYRHYAGAGG